LALAASALSSPGALAQRQRPVRIGAVSEAWGPTPAMVGLREGLIELGYRENEDFVIGVRFTRGDFAAIPAATREFIEQGVDVLLLGSVSSLTTAAEAPRRVPIVFVAAVDPVTQGWVRSYAKPGANVTGVTSEDLELSPKRVELLRLLVPGMKRVLFAYDAKNAFSLMELKAYREAALRLGIELVEKPLRTQEEARIAIAALRGDDVQAILPPIATTLNIPGYILDATPRLRLPTMFHARFWVERGGLASYGPDLHASGRQAARLVDKILRGAKPGDIPIETNSRVEFTLNARIARSMGLTIPREVLHRVDHVIE
jgi:putative ABC transport system substrate-binding protein